MTPGVYELRLYLPRAVTLTVGRLGTFAFPAGRYVYTGSALNGVEPRLARHRRRRKPLHWHIDHLLPHARLIGIGVLPTRRRLECVVNRQTLKRPGARVLARGFGSSDCRCPTHLVYLGRGRWCGGGPWLPRARGARLPRRNTALSVRRLRPGAGEDHWTRGAAMGPR